MLVELSYSKHRAVKTLILLVYYWMVLSRPFHAFLVFVKGESFAEEFREKRRALGNSVMK